MDDEIKRNKNKDLKDELKKAIKDNAAKPKKPPAKLRLIKNEPTSKIINVGNGNINNTGSGNIHINKKETKRVNRLPEPDDINAQQKKFIQEKIYQLADRDVAKGIEIGKARTSWWSRLNNKFYVNSYVCLKQIQFNDVAK